MGIEWDSVVGAVDERTTSEIVEDHRRAFLESENEKVLDDLQHLVDRGVRIRDIEVLDYGCRVCGRRAVTKMEAAMFRESVAEFEDPTAPRGESGHPA